ncbi:iron ABC transporter permease [Variovorax sp. LjRoot84]|uniref:ABC transporter permease n=1 Tax=Variovorax sp. LjRoot84 TaxID=3342340 RepID=UPI003ED00C7F
MSAVAGTPVDTMNASPAFTLGQRLRHLHPGKALVVAVVLALLALLIVYPSGWVISNSLQDDATKAWSLSNYMRIFSERELIRPVLNSLLLAVAVGLLSVLLGAPAAWLVARSDMPARGLVRTLTIAAFVTPSFVGATAWILLAAPNSGWLNSLWRAAAGTDAALFNIYSMTGTIFVSAIYTVPFTFTIVSSALESMAVELEDAATTLGSGTWHTMFSITLPLALPSILAGFILSFIQGVTLFGVPAFLLAPARTQVVTTKLAELYQQFPPQLNLAAAYCIPLLLMTATLFFVRRRLLGRKRFTMISGKSRGSRRVALGRWRWPAFAFALFVPVTAIVLPYAALLLVSLSKAWGRGPGLDNLTLAWYQRVLIGNVETRTAIVNSFTFAIAGATACVLLGTVVAYLVERRAVRATSLFSGLATLPIVVPGVVLSVGFFAAFTRPPFQLYGTAWILIAAFTAAFLPIAFTQASALIKGISPDLERVARSLGASEAHAFREITAPLLRNGLIAAWLLVFIPIIRELSVAVFLITSRTNVMTTMIYNAKDGGDYEALCAMSVLLILSTLVLVGIAQFATRNTARRATEGIPT